MSYILKNKQDMFSLFLACKTLGAIVTLFFSVCFQSSFSFGEFIPSQLYLFVKSLIFVILCRSFLISSLFNDCYSVLKAFLIIYWWNLLFLFCVLFSQGNLYVIHLDSGLFYDIYNNTINEYNQRQTCYLLSIPN